MKNKFLTKFLKNCKQELSVNNIKKISSNSFFRNVVTVATGTTIAQIISILFSPILTRIYDPGMMGKLGVFLSLTAFITPIVALTYPTAIALPDNDKEAIKIGKLSILIALIVSVISAFVFGIFGEDILSLLKMKEILPYVMLIPVFIFFSAIIQVLNQWCTRLKLFKSKAIVEISKSLILNSTKVGFGFINPIVTVLIVIATFGEFLHSFLLFLASLLGKNKMNITLNSEENYSFVMLAKKYKDFPLYRAPQLFINGVTQSLPILILTSFFGPITAGYYTLGRAVLSTPTRMISNSVGNVFYLRAAEAKNKKEKIASKLFRTTLFLAFVGFLPYLIIFVFGPVLFKIIFGSEWIGAGEYTRWMAIWLFFVFLNNPSIRTLPVIHGQRFHLIFTYISIAIRTLMLIIGALTFKSDIAVVVLDSLSGAILNIVLITVIIKKCEIYDSKNIENSIVSIS